MLGKGDISVSPTYILLLSFDIHTCMCTCKESLKVLKASRNTLFNKCSDFPIKYVYLSIVMRENA